MRVVFACVPNGIRMCGLSGIVGAYMDTCNPRSYAGARASAFRLMRHVHVRAAIQWYHALKSQEIYFGNPMPTTVFGVAVSFRDLGCWQGSG